MVVVEPSTFIQHKTLADLPPRKYILNKASLRKKTISSKSKKRQKLTEQPRQEGVCYENLSEMRFYFGSTTRPGELTGPVLSRHRVHGLLEDVRYSYDFWS